MSPGFTSTWRARPVRLGASIHWKPLFAIPRFTPSPLATRLLHSTLTEDHETFNKRTSNHENDVKRPDAYGHRIKSESGTEAVGKIENEQAMSDIKKFEHALERSSHTISVFVPGHKDLGSSRQRRRITRAQHRAVTNQVYIERAQAATKYVTKDWRQVLEELAKVTPAYSAEYIEDGIKIDVDKDILARVLRSTGDDNFGALRKRTGASIKVSRDESTLLLSGTRQAINRATEVFRNMAGSITVTRLFRPLGPGESAVEELTEELANEKDFFVPPLSREEGAYHRKRRSTQHADLTPMPLKWTAKTMYDYVISLVDTYIEPSLHSPTYSPTVGAGLLDHERTVVELVMRLFSNLPPEAGFSGSMVKMAMSYMTQKGRKYNPYVRELFVLSEQRGIHMDTDVFNILLRASVKTRNLHQFWATLRNMTRRRCVPNFDTWVLFLRMFESIEVKSYILQAMHAKNMIGTPETIQQIAQELASDDATHAVVQGKDLATFLQEQEDRYGPDWLTRDAGNKVLEVLGQYRRYEDACRLLDLMSERHHDIPPNHTHERLATRPDVSSFATIINHARIEQKVPLAVNVLRKMNTSKVARRPSSEILHFLFEMAWKKRLRTTIVVIWRYASLARLTSYRMRHRVSALLSGELVGLGDEKMTAKLYHELGGEALARELAGGPQALEQIKAFCRQTWGESYPRKRLASVATKTLCLAFEGYGPAIELGEVLTQSILVDHRCLRARKANQLKDLLASAKVKSLPMWKRQKGQEMWAHLALLDPTDPAMIKHDDIWKDEWDSEGWNAKSRSCISQAYQGLSSAYRKWQPPTEKHIAIINPMVWDDEKRDLFAMDDDQRTQLQRQNEEAILGALEDFGMAVRSLAYVDIEEKDGISMEAENRGQNGDASANDKGYIMDAESRLERIRQMIADVETDMQKDGPLHVVEENDKAETQ